MLRSPAGSELECPRCGTVAVNRDFCSCGEYLGWEVAPGPAAAPEPDYRAPEPAAPRAATLLTLRDPARLDDPAADVAVSVVPGAEVVVLATIRNQGQIVETFDVRVDGLPESWWTVSPATVFLNPWGTSGDYEREVQVRLHPPRTPEAEARAWPFTVVARSRSADADVAWAQATLTVEPYQSTVMHAGPERRRGRRHASFDVTVANHGNCPVEIAVAARDTEERCPVTVFSGRTKVPVGAAASAVVRVGVPRPLIFGRAVDHRVEVTHHALGVASAPQRVMFRQRPWLPWWIPPALALLAAFVAAILLLRREPEVPKLEGDTVEEALVVLDKRNLKLGRTTYAKAPKDVPLHTIIAQEPAAGDDIAEGERVNVTLAAPPATGLVPPVNGLTLAKAADALTKARFGYDPQPSSAGNDWVVVRQDPTPGTRREVGTKVTLAVEERKPAATPTPTVTPTPTPTSTPKPAAKPAPAGSPSASASAKAPTARAAATPAALPAELVFAGATSGQLYRLGRHGARPARLTSPMQWLETPTGADDGYLAVQVADGARRLVHVSPDGRTIATVAEGAYHRPAYSPSRGLVAVIEADGRGDAGKLCVLDPLEPAPVCIEGRRLGRPAWAPNGRSVLALGAGRGGAYDRLFVFTARGGDARSWEATGRYRGESIRSAAWVGSDRVAVLLGAPAHVRLLERRAGGFKLVRDFPELTGQELAASGRYVALRQGAAAGDGAIVLHDLEREQPRVRRLGSGVNPAWITRR